MTGPASGIDYAKALLELAHAETLSMTQNLNQIIQAGQGLKIDVELTEARAYIHAEIVPQPISYSSKSSRPTTKIPNLTPDALKEHLKAKGVDIAQFTFTSDTSGAVLVRKKAKIPDALYRQVMDEIKAVGGEWVNYEQAKPDVTGLWRVKP